MAGSRYCCGPVQTSYIGKACCIVGGIRYRCIHAAVIAADVPRRPPQFLRVAGNRDSPCRHMAAGAGDH